MKDKKTILISTLMLITIIFSLSIMVAAPPTGIIRIDPPLPIMSTSPATFTVWVQGTTDATNPHIFLVMTEASYDGLGGSDVVVSWNLDASSITIPYSQWQEETLNSVAVPPGSTPGAGYLVAALKDHLGVSGSVYWAIAPILDGPIVTGETYTIKVTMTSANPEMLVYVVGKSSGSELYDMAVPPTIPGFFVPEIPLGTIASVLTMLGSVIAFRLRKK